MLSCIPKAASGDTFGSDSRSVERTKKLPWNVWIVTPLRTRNKQLEATQAPTTKLERDTTRIDRAPLASEPDPRLPCHKSIVKLAQCKVNSSPSSPHSHHRLESDLPREISGQHSVQLLGLPCARRLVQRDVVDRAAAEFTDSTCRSNIISKSEAQLVEVY